MVVCSDTCWTKSYIHACIHTHSLIHAHSPVLSHTHSFTLTRLLISLSHTNSLPSGHNDLLSYVLSWLCSAGAKWTHNDLLSFVLSWLCSAGANWTQWSFELCSLSVTRSFSLRNFLWPEAKYPVIADMATLRPGWQPEFGYSGRPRLRLLLDAEDAG